MTRVLIVDDHPQNLYLLRAILEGHGYGVDEAPHGADALTKARQQPPDVIVSDLLMPVLDGYTLLRHWKQDACLRDIPFVVYTATYTEPRDERLARALGADAFLVKPAESDVLLTCIRTMLARKASGNLPSRTARPADEHALLEDYNDVLIRKLEKKALEAEQHNIDLRAQITEREGAEARLRQSDDRFRTTFEQAPVGLSRVRADGTFLWVNDKLCEITGYERAELLQLTFLELTAPEDRPESDAARRSMLAGTQQLYSAEKRYRHKDGHHFWVSIVTRLLRSPAGEPHTFIAVTVDISNRKRTEEALLLRDRAVQAVSQGILITDPHQPDNPIIYVNDAFEQITGYSRQDAVGRNCRFLQGKDSDPDTVATLRGAIAAGRPCAVEVLNYRKDGTPFWNALTLNPVHDETGALRHFVGVQADVTDRRMLENQLRHAQKMEAVGRLAGGVAHDFNNLLTIIAGYSDLLLDVPQLGDAEREAVHAIRDAGERAAALTRQLLGFSRKTMLQPRVMGLNAVITDIGKMLGRLIGEDIRLTMTLEPDLGLVKVDPGQIDQVLMNLAVNARDAMPKGGQLTIETGNVMLGDDYMASHLDAKPGPHVMLAMTDTGSGMTPAVLSRIFEPFFTTKSIDQGTGLGLSVVFGIVQQSDGWIHVYSEPGRGTTFKIYFPIVGGRVPNADDARLGIGTQGTETILLVEDEASVRALARRTLQLHGYTVLAAADGDDALRVLHDHAGPLDLVLTDVVMPNVSGPALVKSLHGLFPQLKVLFMSGYTDDAVVRHGLLQADVAFIQKPYTPLALARKVRQVLEQG